MVKNILTFRVKDEVFELNDPDNSVAAETFSSEGYEPGVVYLLDQINMTSDEDITFFDVGSLYGYYPALIASRYPRWNVNAFEPNPNSFSILEENYLLNNVKGQAYNLALSSGNGVISFKGRKVVENDTENCISVSTFTFDDFIKDKSYNNIVVKIDVHGAEGMVLSGMKQSLAKQKIKNIIIEIHELKLILGNYSYENILKILEEENYEMICQQKNGVFFRRPSLPDFQSLPDSGN